MTIDKIKGNFVRTVRTIFTVGVIAALAAPVGVASAAAAAPPPVPTINQNGVNIHAEGTDLNDPHEVIGRAEAGATLDPTVTCFVPEMKHLDWVHSDIHTKHGVVHGVVRRDFVAGLPATLPGCPEPAQPTPVQ